MLDKQFLDNLSEKITKIIPRAGELGEDAKIALRQLLQKSFAELNLLTQEEFESRVRALERTEQRVVELEHTLRELEEKFYSLSKTDPQTDSTKTI